MGKSSMYEIKELKKIIDGDNLIIEDLVQWVIVAYDDSVFEELLKEMGYRHIAIYGYGHLGKLLERVLKYSDIIIDCIFDMKFIEQNGYYRTPEAINVNSDFDVIIVTSPLYYEDIRRFINDKGFKNEIRLIDDLLFQL